MKEAVFKVKGYPLTSALITGAVMGILLKSGSMTYFESVCAWFFYCFNFVRKLPPARF